MPPDPSSPTRPPTGWSVGSLTLPALVATLWAWALRGWWRRRVLPAKNVEPPQ